MQLSTHSETYLAAVFMVQRAMMNPTIPPKVGTAKWKNLSPVLSECLQDLDISDESAKNTRSLT